MSKLLRMFVVSVGVLVLIGVTLVVVVPHLLDPNAYKDRLSALVKERTGHTLAVGGDIKLAVFPWVALELGPVQLSNAPGFGAAPLAEAQHTSIRVKLLPLLRKQVQIDKISLDELHVHLARDARGQVNWQGVGATSSTQSASGPAMALLEVGGIELRNARLEWDDQRIGSTYQVSDINVHTGRFSPGKPFDVAIGCAVASGENAPVYRIKLNSTVSADPATQRYQLHKTHLELGLPQGGAVTLNSDVDLDLAKQSLDMPVIELGASDFKLTGMLQGSQILDNPDLRGELQLAQFSPRELLKTLGKPEPKSADPAVLSKSSAHFSLRAGRDQVTFKPLSVNLDDSSASGEFTVRNFAKPRVGFMLEVDDINVDRYLPVPIDDKAATPWPVAMLRALNLDGSLHIGRLQAYRLRSTDARITVRSTDSEMIVQPAKSELNQDSYQGDVGSEARSATPLVSPGERLRAAQTGTMHKEL